MDNHLRIYVTGPGYRANIAARSYVVMYDSVNEKVIFSATSEDDQYTLDVVEPDHANPYMVRVENMVNQQASQFTLDSFFPQEPKVPAPGTVMPV